MNLSKLRLFSPIQRIPHTPVRLVSSFIKDIYKSINYNAPITEEENVNIVNILNNSSESELSGAIPKKYLKNILKHREQNGKFERAEQLLDIYGIEITNLEKMCQSILRKDESQSETVDENQNKMQSRLRMPNLIPGVKKSLLDENSTILGLRASLNNLSYALIQYDQLICWGNISLFEKSISASQYQHHHLYRFIQKKIDELPKADFCIQEEPLPILKSDPYVKVKVNLTKLRSYLDCILEQSDKVSKSSHMIKPGTLDKVFSLRIGTERMSMKEEFSDIIGKPADPEENNPHYLQVSGKELNFMKYQGQRGEDLAGACLQALAFRYITRLMEKEKPAE